MAEIRVEPERKSAWTDTEESFKSLLAWLDDGKETNGASYIEMRRRLVSFFERKNCTTADHLADETLSRVSRRLNEEGSITGESPARFCYITAKFVFLEHSRRQKEVDLPLENLPNSNEFAAFDRSRDDELKEKMLDCLDDCASRLDELSREIIFSYYFGKTRQKIENRRSMASKMGMTANALAIKACRIRSKLETCVGKCAGVN